MKNVYVACVVLFQMCSANAMLRTEIGPKATKPSEQWRFELSNKSELPIRVTLSRSYDSHIDNIVAQDTELKPKDKMRIKSLNNKLFDIVLTITYPDKNNMNNEKKLDITIPASRADKQILIKFYNEAVVPQIGTFSGLSGTTESGIKIENNVTEHDIVGNKKVNIDDVIEQALFK